MPTANATSQAAKAAQIAGATAGAATAAVTKCISLRQPWAFLVASGWKSVENRNWKTEFRGTIAIHASATYRDMQNQFVYKWLMTIHDDLSAILDPPEELVSDADLIGYGSVGYKADKEKKYSNKAPFHFGAVIGTVDIVDCLTVAEAAEIEVTMKADLATPACRVPPQVWIDADEGPEYCWLLQNAVLFDAPIPSKGRLQIYDLSAIDPTLPEKVNEARRASLAGNGPRLLSSKLTG